MNATYKPFRDTAMAYNAISDYVRLNCPAHAPQTIEQIFDAVKDKVKNIQQVKDAIKKFRASNTFAAQREGVRLVVWWKNIGGGTLASAPSLNKPLSSVSVVAEKAAPIIASEMPEVKITKTAIHILAGGVKITIER